MKWLQKLLRKAMDQEIHHAATKMKAAEIDQLKRQINELSNQNCAMGEAILFYAPQIEGNKPTPYKDKGGAVHLNTPEAINHLVKWARERQQERMRLEP